MHTKFSFAILTFLVTCFYIKLRVSFFSTTNCSLYLSLSLSLSLSHTTPTPTPTPSQGMEYLYDTKICAKYLHPQKIIHISLSPLLLSFNTICLNCLLCSGLAVSMVMKYADNIVKVSYGNMTLDLVRH